MLQVGGVSPKTRLQGNRNNNSFVLRSRVTLGISTWLELTSVGWQAWVVIIICCIIHTVLVEIEKLIIRHFEIVI